MADAVMRIAGETDRAIPRKINFTLKALAALKVPSGKDRIIVYDTRTAKLAYMLTDSGASSFYYYYKFEGRPFRYRLGDGDLSIDQARKLADAAGGQIANSINPQAQKQAARAEQSFGKVWEWYMQHHVRPRLRTADEIQQKYDKSLKGWASRKFNSITRSDVAALHAKIGAEAPGAANRLVRLLSSLFNRARDIGYDKVNPASGIRLYPENRRDRFVQPHELPAFQKGLKAVSQDMRDLFELALYTGARIGNVKSMEWSEVNFASAVWTIPAAKFKTGKAITIPLVEQSLDILKRRKDSRGDSPIAIYVFPSRSSSGHIDEHKRAWETVTEKSKLTDLHVHDLRHSLASWQAAAGTSLTIIGRSLGHANQATTARYAHVNLDPVRASMAGAVDAMGKASKTRKGKQSWE